MNLTLIPAWYDGFNFGWYGKQETDWSGHEYVGYADNMPKAFVAALVIPQGYSGTIKNITVGGLKFLSYYNTIHPAEFRWTLTDSFNRNPSSCEPEGIRIGNGTVIAPASEAYEIQAGTWSQSISDYKFNTEAASKTVFLFINRPAGSTISRWRRIGLQAPTVTISFKPDEYPVNAVCGDGIDRIEGRTTGYFGESLTLKAVSQSGWEFDRWEGSSNYIQSTTSNPTTVTVPSQGLTVTAYGKRSSYNMSFISSNFKNVELPETQYKYKGEDYILPEGPAIPEVKLNPFIVKFDRMDGMSQTPIEASRTCKYTFTGWNDGFETYSAGSEYTLDKDAVFDVEATDDTIVSAIELPSPLRPGYIFKGWKTSPQSTNLLNGVFIPDSTCKLYAEWEAIGLTPIHTSDGKTVDYMTYICDEENNTVKWKIYEPYICKKINGELMWSRIHDKK